MAAVATTTSAQLLSAALTALEAATVALRQLEGGGEPRIGNPAPEIPTPGAPALAHAPVAPCNVANPTTTAAPTGGTRARVVIALFDYTTLGLDPWRKRGYECHVSARAPAHRRDRTPGGTTRTRAHTGRS